MSYDIKKVREGLAMIKAFNTILHLHDGSYSSDDITKIFNHYDYRVKYDKYVVDEEGERILNDGQ